MEHEVTDHLNDPSLQSYQDKHDSKEDNTYEEEEEEDDDNPPLLFVDVNLGTSDQ